MKDSTPRTPSGVPEGGQFATHDRAEADVTLPAPSVQPMPELMADVTYGNATWKVVHVDGRAAVISRNGDLRIVSDRDLGLDRPAVNGVDLTETLRRRRGHTFYPASMRTWPAIGSQEDTSLNEIPIVAHYFSPNADWYVAEFDPETGNAWGYVRFAHMPESAEWGQFHLPELEQLNPSPLYIVERELDFEATPAGEVIR